MARLPNMPHAGNCSRAEPEGAAQAAATKRRHLRRMAIRALFLGSGHNPLAACSVSAVGPKPLRLNAFINRTPRA
ncbi:MAG: hypothetical protein JRI57_03705 [Deltaproteobacteria bacterium]|nr:hypothetical protein [Deltaproteobacteria bacterium]